MVEDTHVGFLERIEADSSHRIHGGAVGNNFVITFLGVLEIVPLVVDVLLRGREHAAATGQQTGRQQEQKNLHGEGSI